MNTIAKLRTLNICLSDIPKDRMFKSLKTGKYYINLQTWDYDLPDQYDNDFSISISPTKEEIEAKKNGQQIQRVFVGNGKIFKSELTQVPLTDDKDIQQAEEDLPF